MKRTIQSDIQRKFMLTDLWAHELLIVTYQVRVIIFMSYPKMLHSPVDFSNTAPTLVHQKW